ncbi:hypothetical protein MMC07_004621 [Pseudocyphellaria aurata]|nr:hypothetical protein [Pseudocyphellaria aurata]
MGYQQEVPQGWPANWYELDIVATQGAYLYPCPRTPVFERDYHETFAAQLDEAFYGHAFKQRLRRAMYHEAAEESPPGHTPPEVKERRAAELKAMDELPSSDQSSDGDEGDGATLDGKAREEKARPATEQASRTQPREAHGLSTPPLSADSPSPTPQGRKRRRDEEEEYLRKTRVITTARSDALGEDKPDGSQVKGRKRPRTDDVDDEGEGERERTPQGRKRRRDEEEEYPRKTRVITTARPDALEGDKPDGSQVKGRKRPWSDDVDDEGEEERERPVKARKIAAPRRQKRCPPEPPEAGGSQGSHVDTDQCHRCVEHGISPIAEVKQPLELLSQT